MADAAPAGGSGGGFRHSFGSHGGDRGRGGPRGRGRGLGHGRGRRKEDQKEWVPVSKLGRLVREGDKLESIYLFSLPIKEFKIIDFFLGASLNDEELKIMPVQKQTRAGQRTRFKELVAIGDNNEHIGLRVNCSKKVATAIRGLSSWPNYQYFQPVGATGLTKLANPILYHARSLALASDLACMVQ